MMSWWSGRKEDDQNNHHLHLEASKQKQAKKTPNRRRLGRPAAAAAEGSGEEERSTSAASASSPPPPPAPLHRVAETVSGIEVTFSSSDDGNRRPRRGDGNSSSPRAVPENDGPDGSSSTVVSLRDQLARRRKVHRAQFRTTAAAPAPASVSAADLVPPDLSSGRHRVPLFAKTLKRLPPPSEDAGRRKDALELLESRDATDEAALVREELRNLSLEIRALASDRDKLARRCSALRAGGSGSASAAAPKPPPVPSSSPPSAGFLDAHRLLASDGLPAGVPERARLQEQRGLCLSVSLRNPAAREAFLSRLGSTAAEAPPHRQGAVATVRPETCRDGGGAAALQHVALLSGPSSPAESGGFFVSRDGAHGAGPGASAAAAAAHPHPKGSRAYYWGHLPDRLFRRMKDVGMDPKHHACDLLYLSTGPMGAYYAEFRSGERWWGAAAEDTEFDALCAAWDVGRVAFGPGSSLVDGAGREHRTTSWIVLARDGRVAWKGAPSRLHGRLERRLASEAAPVEASLGAGGSYFVRFADGAVDYCLPAAAARACRELEAGGASITSVALHAELPHDFIVRHT